MTTQFVLEFHGDESEVKQGKLALFKEFARRDYEDSIRLGNDPEAGGVVRNPLLDPTVLVELIGVAGATLNVLLAGLIAALNRPRPQSQPSAWGLLLRLKSGGVLEVPLHGPLVEDDLARIAGAVAAGNGIASGQLTPTGKEAEPG